MDRRGAEPQGPGVSGHLERPPGGGLLWEVLRAERPELVHIHHLAQLGFGAARLCAEAGAAVALTLHDPHLLCARGQLINRALELCPGPGPDRCAVCLAEHLRARPGLSALAPSRAAWASTRRSSGPSPRRARGRRPSRRSAHETPPGRGFCAARIS
ncbi:MAG: glycosyltransferase [Deltaproteobacteria bacterium]|nr:glycosyltransferase [Deltaproteobacteria bacterium]